MCRGRFSPADDNKYRIKDDEDNGKDMKTQDINLPLVNPKTATIDPLNPNNKLQTQTSLSKKDLSTISERTERSMTVTRDANLYRLQNIQQNANNKCDNTNEQGEKKYQKVEEIRNTIVPKLGTILL